ncbi:MAG: DUF3623 family protein [Gemmatirosa sp.]|nr:DUF3623 family protein [Gemmatirosa sp.]
MSVRQPVSPPAAWVIAAPLARSALLVVAFWWGATGLTLAMQRGDLARLASLVATSALAIVAMRLVLGTRDVRTAAAARRAFLAAALLWWWTATLFYLGWGVAEAGPPAGPPRSVALALQAIAATWRADVVALAVIAGVAWLVWRRPNRVALWALLVFWATLQTAKLNVFAGVQHAGAELLPDRLTGLRTFFGPARNTTLLPVTIVALAVLGAWLAVRAWRARDGFQRHAAALLAVLLALAVVEHAMLGVDATLPFWDPFLRMRGQ